MVIRALIATMLLLVAPATAAVAEQFKISPPQTVATMTMPCWREKQLSRAFVDAQFEPVTHGLLAKKTDASQPLVIMWMHLLTGRAAVTLSRPSGEECILAVVIDAE
jgi:hypothetical protein